MNILIQSSLNTLNKSRFLLLRLSDEQFGNLSVSPYYSSIGSHIRHILDFYACIFSESQNEIDLTARDRNLDVETYCETAICYLDNIVQKLQKLNDLELDREIVVIDDLGLGKAKLKYTFSALLAQANSHTIHHYAIINYILDRLNIVMDDENFGYNPTTPKHVVTE
ncbi:DinB family protein [Lacinutrix iliipiscaria]|uniref:DinB family protein n=1 Tax=Lacinutrix iliipiscaria TaxID=1230532 RepID=A0ABW5WNA5_9FLAO